MSVISKIETRGSLNMFATIDMNSVPPASSKGPSTRTRMLAQLDDPNAAPLE